MQHGDRPFRMICGGGTTPRVCWHCSLQAAASSSTPTRESSGTLGSLYPGAVATLLYIRKTQVFELDGA